ncbi:EamA family transporter [Streptomyces litchfieldiae]|uniref:EamA family transporter n=1 Tax=Streptomyces litchfieldiae TaxID=3075543 RepID=A0ABU2N175_9ACTN|nr:EamA family transporter [Streptomyces sp. DSM 44938]MDT0347352.1 EamA family transporter [Streptomyces sp. DSM 44938]
MRTPHILLAVLVTAVWGVNFVVIDVGLGHFPPLLFTALRFLVAAVPAVFLVRRPAVARRWIVGVGLALGVGKFGVLFLGMAAGMAAGLASLVIQSQAVFTALIAAVALGERPGRRRVLGMGVALAGITVAAVEEGASGPVTGFALVILSAVFWGVSNVLTRKAAPDDALSFMVWASLVPVLPLTALSLVFEGPGEGWEALRGLDWSGVGAVVFVAWAATLFGFGVWSWLLRRYHASRVAPFALLVPVFGMSSAALLLDEAVTPASLTAAALLVGGVALTSAGGAPRGTTVARGPAEAARPVPAGGAAVTPPRTPR